MTKILELQKVFKSYRSPEGQKINILNGVDLNVFENQSIAILGASGSGKSTLLNVMAGLDSIDNGKVLVNGKNLWDLSDELISRIRNKDFGFIFQSHFLLPEFSALENILIPSWIGKLSNLEPKAKELINHVGLAHRMTHKPSQLSGGESQRVAIARSLINSPKIIFADEPTGNLDRDNADKTIDILLEMVSKMKTSLILVTHDQRIANRMSKRYTLGNGQLHEIT